jgi:predicted transcriptional regulator of viral defense system
MTEDKRVSEIVDELQRQGRYGFERRTLDASLSASPAAIEKALQRLADRGRIKRLRKGFHAIVPVEYSRRGVPPADWFIDDLMASLGQPYYIGLLSAAAHHGAAHQQVQQLQIVVPRQNRPLEVPGLSIRFFRKKNFSATPIRSLKGHSGMLPVSTPEATAIDLVRYARQIGGLDVVLTVLTELAESMQPGPLASAAGQEPETAQLQRLGWLLDHLDEPGLADALHATLPPSPSKAPLDPSASRTGSITGNRWKILENARPEADL